jgi:hypothetical protein
MFDPLDILKQAIKKAQAIQPNSAVSCAVAEITDVNDPLDLGRCKVKIANFTAQNGSIAYNTDWCNTLTNSISKGKLPKSLLGKTALAFPINQSYETVVVNVSNSLIYAEGESLPLADVNNLGVRLIQLTGLEAFTMTCLLRNGVYAWIASCDLKHGHASGDTQDQDNDTGGDFQMSVEQLPIHDTVFSTAVTPYVAESGFTPPLLV